jgi:tetratricopeptide (TPR) repeat protein
MRGLAFSVTDRLDAVKCFKKVLKHDPKHVNAWTGIGKVLYELDKKRHAGEIFLCCEAILEHDPDNMEAWDLIRKMDYKKYPQSIFKCCEIAQKKDPTNLWAWLTTAYVFIFSDQYEEAFHCLNTIQGISPTWKAQMIWNLKGEVAEKLKNHEECLKCYEKAIELYPKDGEGVYIGHAQRMVKKERKYLSEH